MEYKDDLDKQIEQFESPKVTNENEYGDKTIDNMSRFICVVNKPLYFILLALTIFSMLEAVTCGKFDARIAYIVSFIWLIAENIIVYKISYKIKEKHNKLNVVKVKKTKKAQFIIASILVCMVATIILAVYEANKMTYGYKEYLERLQTEDSEYDKSADEMTQDQLAGVIESSNIGGDNN